MDWSDDDLDTLGDLVVKYSGNAPLSVEIVPEKKSVSIPKLNERTFDLYETVQKNPITSTSWATAIVEMAEAAMNYGVTFDPEQLLDCVPKYADMEDGSNGVYPNDIIRYLAEVGFVEKILKFYQPQ